MSADKLSQTLQGKPKVTDEAADGRPTEPLVRRFMPELDTLRGIAVLGVLFFHGFRAEYGGLHFTGAARGLILATQVGVLGVNLFFVLSGFLITGILLDSRTRQDYYRRFYSRRALRILPAYYSLLILLALLRQASASFLGLSLIYLSNFAGIFGVSMDYHPLWSLAVEEHYYILWPAVVRRLRVVHLAIFSLTLCILTPALRGIAFHYGYLEGRDWYTWFSADGLAAGSLLAIFLRSRVSRTKVAVGCTLLLAVVPLLMLAGVPFGILTRQRLLGAALQLTLVDAFFAGILLLSLLLGTTSRKHLVNSPLLRFFGFISYGLYLIHPMIFRVYDRITRAFEPWMQPSVGHFDLIAIRIMIVATASVGLSYISRKYYEEWFLRLKDRVAPEPHEPVGQAPPHAHSGAETGGESVESLRP